MFSTSLTSGQPEIMDALRLHNVLWITKHESRVILFWNNNLTKEETDKYTVKYILIYKFFNSTHERKERLKEKKKIIHLELYSGFNAKVKTQLFAKETEDVIEESGWTKFIYKAPPEKLNPPINVSVSLENRSIKIHWKPPPTIGSASSKCFLYQVKITDHKIVDVTEEKYEYPFHKPAKTCAAQVRAKKEICIRNKIWSEWSEPVFIHDEKTVDAMLLSLMCCLLIFLGGLLICACRRFRCLEVITMPVPHPSDNIKTWLAADEDHHQKTMSLEMEMHSEVGLDVPEENGDENIQRSKCLKEYGLEDLWG
ncbi:hypothetical protein AV530_012550 [Patagioenas fasciata monilis]|uniref:Fibronectin type-III domain-containing protein n=1 Tax=Patagioenas fasciata monilis TaxID=372326 RepID=A0A1V4JBP4_PATFA|nr:hypothetical protein AV530_012550 [Patagioenas fasciata monilis]